MGVISLVLHNRFAMVAISFLILGLVAFTTSTITQDPAASFTIVSTMPAEIDYVVTCTRPSIVNGEFQRIQMEIARGTVYGVVGRAHLLLATPEDYVLSRPWKVFLMGHHKIEPRSFVPFTLAIEPLYGMAVKGETIHEDAVAFYCLWVLDKRAISLRCNDQNGAELPLAHLQPLPDTVNGNLRVVKTWAQLLGEDNRSPDHQHQQLSPSFPTPQDEHVQEDQEQVNQREAQETEDGRGGSIMFELKNEMKKAIRFEVTCKHPRIVNYATFDTREERRVAAGGDVEKGGGFVSVPLKRSGLDYEVKMPWELRIWGEHEGKEVTYVGEPMDKAMGVEANVRGLHWRVDEIGIYNEAFNRKRNLVARTNGIGGMQLVKTWTQLHQSSSSSSSSLPLSSSPSRLLFSIPPPQHTQQEELLIVRKRKNQNRVVYSISKPPRD